VGARRFAAGLDLRAVVRRVARPAFFRGAARFVRGAAFFAFRAFPALVFFFRFFAMDLLLPT
jgi:hypothetical protein